MPKDCKTPCPQDTICNPKSGRCVKKTGAIGKKLVQKNTKTCPNGKIMNPATGRCVKTTGRIGRQLLTGNNTSVKPQKPRTKSKESKTCSNNTVPMSLAEIRAQLPPTPRWIKESYVPQLDYSNWRYHAKHQKYPYKWRAIKDDTAYKVHMNPAQVFGQDVVKVTYQLMRDLLPRVGDVITMHVAFLYGEDYSYDGGYLIDKKFRKYTARRVTRAEMARLGKSRYDYEDSTYMLDQYPKTKEWIVVDEIDMLYSIPIVNEVWNMYYVFGAGHEPIVYTWIKKAQTCM